MDNTSILNQDDQLCISPDGKHEAKIVGVREFQMSGPTYGTLILGGQKFDDGVGVCVCWSEDSKLLAIPKLNASKPEFRIVIIDIDSKAKRHAPGRFGPVGIKEFSGTKMTLVHLDGDEQLLDVSRIKW